MQLNCLSWIELWTWELTWCVSNVASSLCRRYCRIFRSEGGAVLCLAGPLYLRLRCARRLRHLAVGCVVRAQRGGSFINHSFIRDHHTEQLNIDASLVLYTDGPGHWPRPLLVIQRGLGLAVPGGLATLLRRVGLSVGHAIYATRVVGATKTTL